MFLSSTCRKENENGYSIVNYVSFYIKKIILKGFRNSYIMIEIQVNLINFNKNA